MSRGNRTVALGRHHSSTIQTRLHFLLPPPLPILLLLTSIAFLHLILLAAAFFSDFLASLLRDLAL